MPAGTLALSMPGQTPVGLTVTSMSTLGLTTLTTAGLPEAHARSSALPMLRER